MPSSIPHARTAVIPGPCLSREAVEALVTQLATESPQPQAQIVIDCHNIEEVTASGLSALLEFRASFEALRWALVCLTPAMLAAALELRLAERFMICRDAEAARAALQDDAA